MCEHKNRDEPCPNLSEIDARLGRLACAECACKLCDGWGLFRVSIDEDAPCAACSGTGRDDEPTEGWD